jgi:hypothetical protein
MWGARIGRPFDYILIIEDTPPVGDIELPDRTGALLVLKAGVVNLTMGNGHEISMDLPIGILPGDFKTIRAGGNACQVFAAQVSK